MRMTIHDVSPVLAMFGMIAMAFAFIMFRSKAKRGYDDRDIKRRRRR